MTKSGMPAPTEIPPFHLESENKGESRKWLTRTAYIETLHRAAPETDWRAVETQNRVQLQEMRARADKAEKVQGASPLQTFAGGKLTGYWYERGSANQAGSAANAEMDTRTGTIISRSASGNIWKGTLAGSDWTLIDDAARLNYRLRLPNGTSDRLLRWEGITVQYSDNWGVAWQNAPDIQGLKASRDKFSWGSIENMYATSDAVWLISKEWNENPWGAMTVLYRSTDKGRTYAKIFSTMKDLKLWTNGLASATAVFSSEGKIYGIKGAGNYTPMGSLPTAAAGITGGFDNGKDLYLYAYDGGTLYKSGNGGSGWTNQGKTPDGRLTFVSRADHNLLTCGFVDCYRSADGGKTWKAINTWAQYYGDVPNKLHADIMNVNSFFDEQKKEVILICCHGGTYVSYDGLQTVKNLSLKKHNISQYYGTITSFHDPDITYAGSQDQGYQRSEIDTTNGVLNFQQVISGDYGHFVTADSGRTFWMTYPGTLSYLPDPRKGSLSSGWDYTTKGQLWMAPQMADPDNPAAVYMCGGSADGNGGYLYHIRSVNGKAQASQEPFNFGSQITGAAYSPRDTKIRYAMTNKGLFFATFDGGKTWINRADSLPGGHYFYGNCILPSLARDGRVFVSGSGYSNPSVYVSDDNGNSWTPMSDGLPPTLVYRIVATPDEQFIFAATESGPFVYVAADKKWYDLTGVQPGGAPDQTYWSVEYVQPLNVARFSTYGRGVWDFEVADFAPKIVAKTDGDVTNLCERTPVTFVTQTIHGGKYPEYTWKVNGNITLRTRSRRVSLANLRNGDKVTCEVVSSTNGKTAVSTATTMVMRPSANIALDIEVAGEAPATVDKPMVFTAKPSGFTTVPEYLWLINNVDTFRTKTPVFSLPSAVPGDLITCRVRPPANECTVPSMAEFNIGIAEFTAPTCAVNTPASFINSTPYGEKWEWNFGDGTRSTLKNPMKIYRTAGTYTVTLTVQPGNTKRTRTVVAAGGLSIPYSNDFEQNNGGFRSVTLTGDVADMWEWGVNEKGKKFFNGKNGVVGGAKSWITNIGRDQGTGSVYALETPPFSFVGASGVYMLSFTFRQMTGDGGGFNVEVSTDKGASWSVLGKNGDPNWYNTDSLWSLDYKPGFHYFGIDNHTATCDVSRFAGQADVRFRFVNAPTSEAEDGVILDDLAISGNTTAAVSPVETKISTTGYERIDELSKVDYFSPNGKIICTFENLENKTLTVNAKVYTEGMGASAFLGKTAPSDFSADKTIQIGDRNGLTATSGHYRMTIYFTAEEIAGWEKATGNNRSTLSICHPQFQDVAFKDWKSDKDISYGINPTRETVFGGDFAVSAEFEDAIVGGGFGANKPSATGVLESGELSDKLFYPNPATDEVTVAHDDAMSVELRDAVGRTVLTAPLNDRHFSVRGLPAGMYTAVVLGRTGAIAVGKFMKK